jgi:hypothetical protein
MWRGPQPPYGRQMIRRILLVLLAGAAVVLVPWTTYLAGSLPDQHDTGQWRLAWVGFDCALLCCFAAGAWLGVHRHRAAPAMLTATAVLLCCDAWFDVVLDWAQPDRATSVLMAAFVEVPLAVVLVLRAKQLLVGGLTTRQLTARADPPRWPPRSAGARPR